MSIPPRRSKVNSPATAPRARRSSEGAEQRGRSGQRHRMELAPPGPEPHDLPSAFTRVAGQGRPRVDRMWQADRVQKRHILVTIGVRVTILKRDSLASGEFLDRGQLAFPPRGAASY